MLFVQRCDTKEVFRVVEYVCKKEQITIKCEGWPGVHVLNKCQLIVLKPKHAVIVNAVLNNPDKTIKEIAQGLKTNYKKVFDLVAFFGLPHKSERIVRKEKTSNRRSGIVDSALFAF